MCEYTAKDYKKGQPRWCPGCGDHFFLASLHKAMAEIGKAPWENAVISGIGCSSRLPYYMNTYAMQTIHGRAAAISTGAKVANPNLTVWQISGDGDGLAIGGNHFIHAVRQISLADCLTHHNGRSRGHSKYNNFHILIKCTCNRICRDCIGTQMPENRCLHRYGNRP